MRSPETVVPAEWYFTNTDGGVINGSILYRARAVLVPVLRADRLL